MKDRGITHSFYTTAQAAKEIGADPSTVRRIAAKHKVGQQPGRERLFTAAEVEQLRGLFRGAAGNPNMTAGNQLWRRREKLRKKRKKTR